MIAAASSYHTNVQSLEQWGYNAKFFLQRLLVDIKFSSSTGQVLILLFIGNILQSFMQHLYFSIGTRRGFIMFTASWYVDGRWLAVVKYFSRDEDIEKLLFWHSIICCKNKQVLKYCIYKGLLDPRWSGWRKICVFLCFSGKQLSKILGSRDTLVAFSVNLLEVFFTWR